MECELRKNQVGGFNINKISDKNYFEELIKKGGWDTKYTEIGRKGEFLSVLSSIIKPLQEKEIILSDVCVSLFVIHPTCWFQQSFLHNKQSWSHFKIMLKI